jgi:hypothetical protein
MCGHFTTQPPGHLNSLHFNLLTPTPNIPLWWTHLAYPRCAFNCIPLRSHSTRQPFRSNGALFAAVCEFSELSHSLAYPPAPAVTPQAERSGQRKTPKHLGGASPLAWEDQALCDPERREAPTPKHAPPKYSGVSVTIPIRRAWEPPQTRASYVQLNPLSTVRFTNQVEGMEVHLRSLSLSSSGKTPCAARYTGRSRCPLPVGFAD